jgi:hypothetical protein
VEEATATGYLFPGQTCPHGRSILPGNATVYCNDCRRSYDLRPLAAVPPFSESTETAEEP